MTFAQYFCAKVESAKFIAEIEAKAGEGFQVATEMLRTGDCVYGPPVPIVVVKEEARYANDTSVYAVKLSDGNVVLYAIGPAPAGKDS